jgi:hypothetical protein
VYHNLARVSGEACIDVKDDRRVVPSALSVRTVTCWNTGWERSVRPRGIRLSRMFWEDFVAFEASVRVRC